MKSLEDLKLYLHDTDATDESFAEMFKANLNSVKIFRISFGINDCLDKSLQILAKKTLPSMTALDTFELKLTSVTEKSIEELFLTRLDTVRTFKLELDANTISDMCSQAFAKNMLAPMSMLESFSLTIQSCFPRKVTDKGFSSILATPLRLIKTLQLKFKYCNIGDDSIYAFTSGMLPSTNMLESFDIHLGGKEIHDSSIATLLSSDSFKKLKIFKVDFCWTQISDISIKAFTDKTLPFMKKLESFCMNLAGTSVTDDGMALMFSTSLNNVKEFEMNLSDTKIGDASIIALTKWMLPSMKVLENFFLDIGGTLVTDESIVQMLSINFQTVKQFTLCLSDQEVSNRSIETFMNQTLLPSPVLEKFELDVSRTKVSSERSHPFIETSKNS